MLTMRKSSLYHMIVGMIVAFCFVNTDPLLAYPVLVVLGLGKETIKMLATNAPSVVNVVMLVLGGIPVILFGLMYTPLS